MSVRPRRSLRSAATAAWLDRNLRGQAERAWYGTLRRVPDRPRQIVSDRLPAWAQRWVERTTTSFVEPLDPRLLEPLATGPPERLADARFLTEELLPGLGLGGLDSALYPPELLPYWDRGVRSIQFPNQFGPYLAELTRRDVASYLELGVAHGGTFAVTVELLRRFGLRRAVAADIDPSMLWLYAAWRPEVTLASVDSHTPAFGELLREHGPFDLVLIDADHSEPAVRADFEAVRRHARMLAFHDIAELNFPDVAKVWSEFREQYADEYEFREFVEQYPGHRRHLGIGLAIRREFPGA